MMVNTTQRNKAPNIGQYHVQFEKICSTALCNEFTRLQ